MKGITLCRLESGGSPLALMVYGLQSAHARVPLSVPGTAQQVRSECPLARVTVTHGGRRWRSIRELECLLYAVLNF